ncbi:MAG: FtsX-like permease family protein [Anaerolineae bacterium]|nr:FtsX-like permease family protein [Anaerolineae bacterium]
MHLPILFRLAQRSIARSFLQSVLFIVGVALGVAVVVAIDLANGSASRAFALSTETVTGKATHQIIGGANGLPTELYRQLRAELHLEAAAPVVEDYVRSPELGNRPLRLLGVDPFAEPPFRDYLTNVQVGGEGANAFEALNQFLAQPNAILISAGLAQQYGLQPGDTVTLQPGGRPVTATIAGTLATDDPLTAQALDGLILTDIASAQEIAGHPDTISRIDLILPDGFDVGPIRSLLPPDAAIATTRDSSSALAQMTSAFELNLQALSLLALVVGMFLIYNTVTFSVVRRRQVLGTMRALGATQRQVFTLILGEALLLGLIGTIIGLSLGILFGRASVGLIAQTISDLYFTVSVQGVTVDGLTMAKGVAVGLLASLFAAIVPSIDATRTPPAGSMRRSSLEERTRRLLPWLTAGAAGLIVLGIVLLALPISNLSFGFGGLFAIVVGGALLTPALLVLLMPLITPVTGRLFGVPGTLGPRSVSRSLSRTSIAVAALTVAVSVIAGVSIMIGSFRSTIGDWLDVTLGADIYVSPPALTAVRSSGDFDPALADAVRALPGVERVVAGRNVSTSAPDYPQLPPANLNVADGEVTSSPRQFVWRTEEDYWPALLDGGVMVSEPFAFRRGITPENAEVALATSRGNVTFPVIGVYYDYTSDQGAVFMANPVYRQYYDDPYISTLAVFLQPGSDANAALEAVQAELAGTDMLVRSNRALRDNVFEVFERTFAITQALRMLAVAVAFIGILSALMALQIEQARQFGVMRANGMSRRQLWAFTLIQTAAMGVTAGLAALPIGTALAVVLIAVINVRSFGWTMQLRLDPAEYALAFAVAVAAAVAAGFYPAFRLGRMNISRALRTE